LVALEALKAAMPVVVEQVAVEHKTVAAAADIQAVTQLVEAVALADEVLVLQ
jgi:hypothetical protein